MSLDQLYSDDIEAGIRRDLARPAPPVAPSFSAWGMMTGGVKGVPAGVMEAGASWMDLLGPAQRESLRHPKPAALADQPDDTAQRMATAIGVQQAAGNMRQSAKDFAPNPETAHAAEQTLFGLTRVGTKAVAAVGTMGPVAGGAALAGEETNTQYRELIAKGIDPDTALKVAGITGVATGAGAVIPMAGPTVKATLGLVVAGGPGLYVAQEAAAKKVLEKAGYHDEASLHDPTDPLGLAISTILPAAFGGAHIVGLKRSAPAPQLADIVQNIESNGKRFDANGQLLTSNKGAQGEMQVMPGTSRDPGFGVAPAKDGSPEELARVGRDYIAAMQTRYGDDAKALAAYNAGPGAVDAAVKMHGDAWLDHLPDETQKYVAKGMKQADAAGLAHAASDPAVVDAARTRVTDAALERSLPADDPQARADVLNAADQLAAGEHPNVREIEFDPLTPDQRGSGEALLKPFIEEATAAKPAFDAAVLRMAEAVGGEAKLAPVKGIKRATEKMMLEPSSADGAPSPHDIKDLLRATIAVHTLDEARAALAQLGSHFDIVRVKDRLDTPTVAGYRDILTNVRLPNGRLAEVQINTKAMLAAKDVAHKLYEQERKLPKGDARAEALQAQQREIYAAAFADSATRDSKTSFETGNPYEKTFAGSGYGLPEGRTTEPSGNLTTGTSPTSKNFEPSGNDFISASEPILRPSDSAANDLPPPNHVEGVTNATRAASESKPAVDVARVKQVTEEMPDLRVKLPGSDETLSVEAALERAKAEHAEEIEQGDWVKAAVACALSFG